MSTVGVINLLIICNWEKKKMKQQKFLKIMTERFLEQPPQDTVYFTQTITGTVDCPRLWIGYNSLNQITHKIYCPYQIGNRIPHHVIKIEPIFFDNHWRWQITVELIKIICSPKEIK